MDEQFRDIILGIAEVEALIDTRCRPVALGQNDSRPNVIYACISDISVDTHDGPSGDRDVIYRVTVRSDEYGECSTIGDAIRDELHLWDEDVPALARHWTVFHDQETDTGVFVEEGKGSPIFKRVMDFKVMTTT